MSVFAKVISLFLFATFKFFWAVFLAIGYDLHWLLAAVTLMFGGVAGVFIFVFVGDQIMRIIQARFVLSKRKKFNRQNRWIVKVKQKGGLIGLSVLTPVLFSIPIGVLAAVAIGFKRKYILLYMSLAVVFWSFFLLIIYALTGWHFTL